MEILEIVLETVLRALRDPIWQGVGVRGRSENRICGIMMAAMPF